MDLRAGWGTGGAKGNFDLRAGGAKGNLDLRAGVRPKGGKREFRIKGWLGSMGSKR